MLFNNKFYYYNKLSIRIISIKLNKDKFCIKLNKDKFYIVLSIVI